MMITALIATPETDAALRKEYRQRGAQAKIDGVAREDCPVDGMIKDWWLEGWDNGYHGDIFAA